MFEIHTYFSEDTHSNTYLLVDSESKEAAVVDPSHMPSVFDVDLSTLNIKYILLTHAHFDHMFKLDKYVRDYGAKVCVHAFDAEFLSDADKNCSTYFMPEDLTWNDADITFEEGQKFCIGQTEITAIHTPGHTPGSVCFICGDALFSGDTLFYGSRGRTDFPGGNDFSMRYSLERLKNIDKNYTVYCGHGQQTTLDREKKFNNYLLYSHL